MLYRETANLFSRAVETPHGHEGTGDCIPRQLTWVPLSHFIKVVQSGDHHFNDSAKLWRGKVMLNYKLIASGLISRCKHLVSCVVEVSGIGE